MSDGCQIRESPGGRTDLTCDSLVTYCPGVSDDDRVFKALADPTRRLLLDRLFARDGRTLTELESELEMTRFGVMKHLRVLEEAGLVVTRRSGREKLHFLNPVPIRLIHDRWIDKYTERRVSALVDLKTATGGERMTTATATTTQVYQVFIKATPEQVWDAITKPEFTTKYFHGSRIEMADGRRRAHGPTASCGATRRSSRSDPPRRLVHEWRALYDPIWPPRSRAASPGRSSRRTAASLQADGRPRPARGRARRRRRRWRAAGCSSSAASRRCSRPANRSPAENEPAERALRPLRTP